MADGIFQAVPPPSNSATEPSSAFADALKRAKEIAARMGSGVASEAMPTSAMPDLIGDMGRKRLLEDGDDPMPKKAAQEGVGPLLMDGKDPKSIAMQVAASIAQRAGLGSMTTEEMKIPNKYVGLVIGRGGEQINKLQSETGARIQVAPDPPTGLMSPPDRLVTIGGSIQAVEKAKAILNRICEEGKIPDTLMSVPVVAPGETVCEIMIPASKVGLIIGKGGETIKNLQERAQCRMMMVQDGPYMNAPEKPLRIMGDPTRCQRGKDLVTDLLTEKELERGKFVPPDTMWSDQQLQQTKPAMDYMGKRSNDYGTGRQQQQQQPLPPGSSTLEIPVPRDVVGFVIGKNGETIKRIQNESGARVQFNPAKDNPNNSDRMATVQGTQEQIQKVQSIIREIVDQSRQRGGPPPRGPPANMPGVKTLEFPVPGNKCGLIIGKGGETIRQIIAASGAHVELNRAIPENSPTKCFIIRGTDPQIQQAEALIREKVEDPRGGGGRGRGNGGNYNNENWNGEQNSNWNQQQNWSFPYGQQQQQQQQQYGQQQFGGQQQYGGGQQGQQQPQPQQQQGQQPAQGQTQDYTAAWAAYYQQYYQQQAAAAAVAAGGQTPGGQTQGSQPDYSAAWNEYFKQQQSYYGYNPYAQGTPGQQPQPGAQPPAQGQAPQGAPPQQSPPMQQPPQ